MPTLARAAVFATSFAALTACVLTMAAAGTTPVGLFTEKGEPKGWSVHAWDDVSKPGPEGAKWTVDENGVLNGSEPRGTWLVSDKEYGDFTIEFDWKLGERGNSGFGVRFPPKGDPAFDGMEIQMNDVRYNNGTDAPPLKDRPRRGHIGFQELSRGGAHVMIKNVVLTELGQ